MGGQVVAEITSGGTWLRGYIYLGGQLLAVQAGGVFWSVTDPITKSPRLADSSGVITSIIELDPWGSETQSTVNRNTSQQPRKYTTYERDANQSDEAMMRRLGRWGRFEQPDPYDGSYNLSDPQSFNRYAYVQHDPVNLVDPNVRRVKSLKLQIAKADFARLVGSVDNYVVVISVETDGWHITFHLKTRGASFGGGANYILDKETGKILDKKLQQ
jgi:RHS repeat-associated protein